MTSVHPAVTLGTISSAWTARELSTGGASTHPIGPSAPTDTVPDGVVMSGRRPLIKGYFAVVR